MNDAFDLGDEELEEALENAADNVWSLLSVEDQEADKSFVRQHHPARADTLIDIMGAVAPILAKQDIQNPTESKGDGENPNDFEVLQKKTGIG